MTILPGDRVAKILGITRGEQIQPNGVDLRLDEVYSFPKSTFDLDQPGEKLVSIHPREGVYQLVRGAYLVSFVEKISIPKNAVGMVLPRSTLLRHGLDLRTALWDSGYRGRGKCLLISYREKARLSRGSRIAQMLFIKAESPKGLYEGQYQDEE